MSVLRWPRVPLPVWALVACLSLLCPGAARASPVTRRHPAAALAAEAVAEARAEAAEAAARALVSEAVDEAASLAQKEASEASARLLRGGHVHPHRTRREARQRDPLSHPDIASFLSQFVLIKTPNGYILGRSHRSAATPLAQSSSASAANANAVSASGSGNTNQENNFQLRQRRLPAENNFMLRVRKSPRGAGSGALNNNFQLRVRKPYPYEGRHDNNFQLRVRKALSGRRSSGLAEGNFQLRVRKAGLADNFQLRVRKPSLPAMADNFQLRVRKDGHADDKDKESMMIEHLLSRYGLVQTPDGYVLANLDKRESDEADSAEAVEAALGEDGDAE